jgi:hypothetical protein
MSYWIEKQDFDNHKTYVIKCPGTYKLKENISFSPKCKKDSAIVIESCDVVLDLNGKQLKQSKHSRKTQNTGIVVKSGHKNVTILGNYGMIKNFSQRGIYVEGGNDYVTIGNDAQLFVTNCGYGTPVSAVDNGEGVSQCGVQLGDMEYSAAIGLGKFNGILNHLSVKNLVVSENNIGCALGEGFNYSFQNCSFSKNLETRLLWDKIATLGGFYNAKSVVTYGLYYLSNPAVAPGPGLNNVVFENSKFNNNTADGRKQLSDGSYTNGFIFANNFKNLKIKNCQFNQNETFLVGNGDNITRGLVIGAGVGTVVEDSEFSDNKGGNQVMGCGFSGLAPQTSGTKRTLAPSESTTVRRCVASRNSCVVNSVKPVNPGQPLPVIDVRGFSLKFPSGARLIECVAEDNKVTIDDKIKDNAFCFADGIYIFSDSTIIPEGRLTFTNNVEIRTCKLSRNRVTSTPVGSTGSFGPKYGSSSGVRVADNLCENILIKDCFISDNQPDADESKASPDFITTGIDLYRDNVQSPDPYKPSYVTICDNVIQSNGQVGIDNTLSASTIQGNKIIKHELSSVLLGSQEFITDCCIVTDNTFSLSQTAVFDYKNPSTNIVANNKSYNTPCGYSVFYSGDIPAELVTADLPNFPTVSGPLSNIQLNSGDSKCGSCPVEQLVAKNLKRLIQYKINKKSLMVKRK